MDSKDNKPSTPSRRVKKEESEFLEPDECRTAVETESLTDASIPRVPPPVAPQTPRDAWANVAPTSQPRVVPSTRLSQADRDAHEIAASTQRALETLRKSSDPRNRLFVSPHSPAAADASQTTPKRGAKSPFRPFSGQGHTLNAGEGLQPLSSTVRTAVAASPAQTSVRTAAARSPDVRTGLENSGRSARLREAAAHQSRSRSEVRTARSGAPTPKKPRSRSKSGCSTVHTATANYEIDLRQRQRTNSVTGPTTNVSTARTISPASRGRSPVRPAAAINAGPQFAETDYPPLPSEGDPTEQTVELIDPNRASQEYTPHISRPIYLGPRVSTARAHSPARTRTLSERTALDGTPLKTSRSPMTRSEKSLRTARSKSRPTSAHSLNSTSSKRGIKHSSKRSTRKTKTKSQSQSSLSTTSARSFASDKSWATAQSKTPRRKSIRGAQKSASLTPASIRSSRRSRRKTGASKPTTPLRTAACSARSPAEITAISPDVTSSKRSPRRTSPVAVRPITPDTPKGWPYRAPEQIQMRQTPVRIAPSASKTAAAAASKTGSSAKSVKSLKSIKSKRSQKELHREAKSGSSASRRSRYSNNPTSNVSTARTITHHPPSSSVTGRSSDSSFKSLSSSKTNARTLSATTLKSAKLTPVTAVDNSPDLVINTVQAHGNIEIDLCFNFRVRAPPGQGFGESRSPLKAKEVIINGQPIWRQE